MDGRRCNKSVSRLQKARAPMVSKHEWKPILKLLGSCWRNRYMGEDGWCDRTSKPVVVAGNIQCNDQLSSKLHLQRAAQPDMNWFIYEKVSVGNGAQANNPWLQELPDPISESNLGTTMQWYLIWQTLFGIDVLNNQRQADAYTSNNKKPVVKITVRAAL